MGGVDTWTSFRIISPLEDVTGRRAGFLVGRRVDLPTECPEPQDGINEDGQHAGGDERGGVLRFHPVLVDADGRDHDDERQPVDERMLSAASCALSRTRRKATSVGRPRVKRNSTAKSGTSSSTFGLWISACRSKLTPLSMKKIGMRNPNPMASSLLVIVLGVALPPDEQADDDARGEGAEQDVEAELEGQVDEKDDQRDRDPDGELGRRVQVAARAWRRGGADAPGWPAARPRRRRRRTRPGGGRSRCASRLVSSTATATIGPNSPIAPTDRMVGPNDVLQHAGVTQDREQGAERRRREAQPDNDGVEDEPGGVQDAADAQAEHERTEPGRGGPLKWPSRMRGQVELECRPGTSGRSGRGPTGAVTMVLGCVRASTKGPMMMPRMIWMTTSGTGTNRREQVGEDRRQHRREADEQQRGTAWVAVNGLAFAVSPARRGTPEPPPGQQR